MAKGKSKTHTQTAARSHPPTRTAKTSVLLPVAPSPSLVPRVTLKAPVLSQVEDRRRFHFDGPRRPALKTSGMPARVVAVDRNRAKPSTWSKVGSPARARSARAQINRFGPQVHSQTKGQLVFDAPKHVVVCIRRQRRKEVLHALNKAGKGGMRPPRRNWLSRIGC